MALMDIVSLQCLCIPGVVIMGLISLLMAYSLYRYLEGVGEDSEPLFKTLLIGVLLLFAAQVVAFVHGPIHHVILAKYVPTLRVAQTTLELAAYVMVFWSGYSYFRRFEEL